VTAAALVAEHGSPLWLADVDRFRANLRGFRAAWREQWPATRVAYSYKTNQTPALLHAAEQGGASPEVTCEAEYELAAGVVEADPASIVVDGPAKPDALLRRAGAGGALVLVDSAAELRRAADLGCRRVGLRVALPSFSGARTRFGIPPGEIPAAARSAAALGLAVDALSTHLVSTDFDPSGRIVVSWPRPADEHARAARTLAGLVADLAAAGKPVGAIDLGGGLPPAPAARGHARAVAAALRDGGFDGVLLLEPGRALVADAVDLAFTVVAVKTLGDGGLCLTCDAGTNLLPGALTAPPRIVAPEARGEASPALVTGPLCLNTDVLHPRAALPPVAPGAVLVARAVGAYQQACSSQFGGLRPAVLAREGRRWRVERPAESLSVPFVGDDWNGVPEGRRAVVRTRRGTA
jgi:diaminopimelate decarboxylase